MVDGSAFVEAAQNGIRFEKNTDGTMSLWTVPESSNTLVLRFAPVVKSMPDAYENVHLVTQYLKLDPTRDYDPVVPDNFGQLQTPASYRDDRRRRSQERVMS